MSISDEHLKNSIKNVNYTKKEYLCKNKMKKISTLLLMFCYLVPAIGLSVKQHYCGGELASVSILFNDSPSCSCGKKPMKKDCCKDKITVLKLKDTQNSTKKITSSFAQNFKFLVQSCPVFNYNFFEVDFEKQLPFPHAPPFQKSEPLYLLNSVFLI